MLRWWEGWGGVGHVSVMFMLRWCYVDGRGGVGHVNVMFMLRCCKVDGRGGVGWGMLTSCSCYVVHVTRLMGGVGWGGACYRHVHATLMLRWWEGWGGLGHVNVMFMLWRGGVRPRGGIDNLVFFEVHMLMCIWRSYIYIYIHIYLHTYRKWSWSNNEQKRAAYQHVPFIKIHCKYQ